MLNVYKPGQGYWTRLISGIGGGVLVLAGAWWLWQLLSTLTTDYRMYIQAGVAVSVIAILGLLLFWLVGVKPRTSDFLIATEGEMKKVNWPTRREVTGSTMVVIGFVFLLVALLFVVDIFFAAIFRWLQILQ